MELRKLNTFLRVAALQNFTRASQELGYSQSNVSAQIKQPEQELSHPLLTGSGGMFFSHPMARACCRTLVRLF